MVSRFSNKKPLSKKNIDAIPKGKPGAYRITDKSGKALYIGSAKGGRLNDRIAEHRGKFQGGTHFQYIIVSSKDAAEKLEKEEIRKHNPPFNEK